MLVVTNTLVVWPESAMPISWLLWAAASFEKTGGS